MRPSTRSGGNLKAPMSRLERMTRRVVLSSARTKNAFQSPGATQRGPRRATLTLSGSSLTRRPGGHGVANEPAHPLGEGLAPGQAAATLSHFRVGELDLGREPIADPDAKPIGLALARAHTIEQHFRMQVLALGVGLREIPEPARHLIVVTAAEQGLPLTLVEAAGQTLLAPFLVDEGRLSALLAEIADPAASPFGRLRGLRGGATADADVLPQRAGECVRQREHLGRAEARGLAAADPCELTDDLLEPPSGRQGRGQAEHERDEAPEGLGHRHRVRARLADLDEDLEGVAARRLVDGDEGRADGRLHAVGGARDALRPVPDHPIIERVRRLRRPRRVAALAHVEHLPSLAAVAKHGDAETALAPGQKIRVRHVLSRRVGGQVDGLGHAVVGMSLEGGLVAHMPAPVNLVRGLEDGARRLRDSGDAREGAAAGHLTHEGIGVEPSLPPEALEALADERQDALAVHALDPVLEGQREDRLDARGAAGDHGDGARGRDGGHGGVPERAPALVDGPLVVREGPALLGKPGRLVVADVLDEGHEAPGQRERLLAVVRNVEGKEEVGPAHDAQPDAAVRLDHGIDRGQRIRIDLDHVVEEAHGEADHTLELVPVKAPPSVLLSSEAGDIERAQVARLVGQQRLLTALVNHEAIGDHRVALRLGQIVDAADARRLDADHGIRETLRVEAAIADTAEAFLFGSEEADGPSKDLARLAEDPELEEHTIRSVGSRGASDSSIGEDAVAGCPRPVEDATLDAEVQQENLYTPEQLGALGCQRDPRAVGFRIVPDRSVRREERLEKSDHGLRGRPEDRRRHDLVRGAGGADSQANEEIDEELAVVGHVPDAPGPLDGARRMSVPFVDRAMDPLTHRRIPGPEAESHPAVAIARSEPAVTDQPAQDETQLLCPDGWQCVAVRPSIRALELGGNVEGKPPIGGKGARIALDPDPMPARLQLARRHPPAIGHDAMVRRAHELEAGPGPEPHGLPLSGADRLAYGQTSVVV